MPQTFEISAVVGGVVETADGLRIKFEPGSLERNAAVHIEPGHMTPDGVTGALTPIGKAWNVSLSGGSLTAPVTLELPFDVSEVEDAEGLVLAYLDAATGAWVPVETTVHWEAGLLSAEVTHFSWWSPFDWNWASWAAGLDAVLRGRVVDIVQESLPFFNSCDTLGTNARVINDRNLIQGCILSESRSQIVFRLNNPRTFPIGLFSASAALPDMPKWLPPGESLDLAVSTSSPSPATVVGSIPTMSTGLFIFFVDSALSAIPGDKLIRSGPAYWQALGFAAITLDGEIHALEVSDDLMAGNPVRAAEKLLNLLASQSTAELISRTLAEKGLIQVSAKHLTEAFTAMKAAQSILRAMDYLINSALNGPNEVQFVWTSPTPTPIPPTPVIEPAISSLGCPESADVNELITCNPAVVGPVTTWNWMATDSASPNSGTQRAFSTRFQTAGPQSINLSVCNQSRCKQATANLTIRPLLQRPNAPTTASIRALGPNSLVVEWLHDGKDVDGFRVVDGVGTYFAGRFDRSVTISGLVPGTYRCATVVAYNAAGEAGLGAGCATTEHATTPPAPPSNVFHDAMPGPGPPGPLFWIDESSNEAGFNIWEFTAECGVLLAGSVPPNTEEVILPPGNCPGVPPEKYGVSAFNEGGESEVVWWNLVW